MKRLRVLGLLGAAAVAVVSLGIGAPAHADELPHFPIRSANDTLLCLEPAGDAGDVGTPIVQTFCNLDPTQAWFFHPLGGDSYQIENIETHLCLDAFGGATNGTPIVEWTCANISNQKWDATGPLAQTEPLVSQVAGTHTHCLDVPGAQQTNGLAMQLFRCNNSSAQAWNMGNGRHP